MRLKGRVEALERCNPMVRRWHRLIVHPGDCVDDAVASRMATLGPMDSLIVREIVCPA